MDHDEWMRRRGEAEDEEVAARAPPVRRMGRRFLNGRLEDVLVDASDDASTDASTAVPVTVTVRRGRPKVEGRGLTLTDARPWIAAGMSRSAWYARRKETR